MFLRIMLIFVGTLTSVVSYADITLPSGAVFKGDQKRVFNGSSQTSVNNNFDIVYDLSRVDSSSIAKVSLNYTSYSPHVHLEVVAKEGNSLRSSALEIADRWGGRGVRAAFSGHASNVDRYLDLSLTSWNNGEDYAKFVSFLLEHLNLPHDVKESISFHSGAFEGEYKDFRSYTKRGLDPIARAKEAVSDEERIYDEEGLKEKITKILNTYAYPKKNETSKESDKITMSFEIAKVLLDSKTPTQNSARNASVAIDLLEQIPHGHPSFEEAKTMLSDHALEAFDPTNEEHRQKQAIAVIQTLCDAGEKASPQITEKILASVLLGYPKSGIVGNVSECHPWTKPILGRPLVESFVEVCQMLPKVSQEVKEKEEKLARLKGTK